MEDNNRIIEGILNANQHLTEKYWIVIFAKDSKCHVDGKLALVQHIKPYKTKPQSMVGQIIAEVDNSKGTISWEINMPDIPFEYEAVPGIKSIAGGERVVETTTLSNAYIL